MEQFRPPCISKETGMLVVLVNSISHLWQYAGMAGSKMHLDRKEIIIESELNVSFETTSLEDSWWAILMYERISLNSQTERYKKKKNN